MTVTADDVVLLRAGSGTIHLGVPLGRGFDTFCCHMVESRHVRSWTDAAAEAVLARSSRYLCDECADVSARPWRIIRRITGW